MSANNAASLRPTSSGAIPWTEWSEAPRFSLRYKHLTRAVLGDDYHVGVAIEEFPSGSQSSPVHYHLFEEEHVYMLEGAVTARIGSDAYEMTAGDYVCYPAGQKAGHCLINNSSAPARYVIIGERNRNEVAVYTDSTKVLVRGLRRVLDLEATRGYWHGEETGLPTGETPPSNTVRAAPETPAKPRAPISADAVEWNLEGVKGSSQFGGRSKHLTYAAVGRPDYRVGVLIEAPAPGMRLCPRHYHMVEEEQALILEGEVTLLLGEDRHVMKAGDYVCFPAGQKIGHSFLNSGTGPCRYLMIGEHSPHEVCVYPDSNKVMVRALRSEADIFDMAAVRKYWDGEETS